MPAARTPNNTVRARAARAHGALTLALQVNTGLGADERRIQLWRPAPLLLSAVTTSSSTYTGAFPARSEQAPQSPPPAAAPKLPFTGESSSRADYPGYRPEASPARTQEQPSPSKLPFTGFSSTKADFPGHRPSSAAAPPTPTSASPRLPFVGQSTSKSDYVGHSPHSASQPPGTPPPPSRTRLDLVGQSTTKADFPGHAPEPHAQPPGTPPPSSRTRLDLVGQSTTKADFPGHAPEAFTPSKAYFDGQTTRSARIPLQGESESRAAFAGWRLVRRVVCQRSAC